MANLRRMLDAGEDVVVDVRPHWWYLAGPISLLVAVIAGAITAAVEAVPNWLIWITLAVLAASAGWLVVRYIRWSTTRLIVTTTRVIERRGVLARKGREIPLRAVSDIGYHQSIFDRIVGMGDVLLESAGRDSQEVFPDLPNPAAIHNEIYRQIERIQAGAPQAASIKSSDSSIPSQIDQLDQLRRKGVITEDEFEAKKAQLLDRL